MYCPNCKLNIPGKDNFCRHCGGPLVSIEPMQSAPEQTAPPTPAQPTPTPKKDPSCLLKMLNYALWFFSIQALLISNVGTVYGIILPLLGAGFIGWKILRGSRPQPLALQSSYADYIAECRKYSEKELFYSAVSTTLEERYPDLPKPSAKKTLKLHVLYTVIFLILHLAILYSFYYSGEILGFLLVLWLIYLKLMTSATLHATLYREAKKRPDASIEDLLQRAELYDEKEHPRSKILYAAGIAGVVLTVVGLFAAFPNTSFSFEKNDTGYTVTACSPAPLNLTEITIPDEYEGEPVTAIDSGVFSGFSRMKTVHLPKTLTAIGGEAFMDCSSLEAIVIPEGVTEIRGNTFDGCSALKSVTLHNGIVAIHGYAFMSCYDLEEITLPTGITEIRAYTFENCNSLREIVIPDGVTRIAAHAFYGCEELHSVTVPDSVTEIGSSAFRECDALMDISLPRDAEVHERAFKDSPTRITYREKQEISSEPEEDNEAGSPEANEPEEDLGSAVYSCYYVDPNDSSRVITEGNSVEIGSLPPKEPYQKAYVNRATLLTLLTRAKEQGVTTVRDYTYIPGALIKNPVTGEISFGEGTYIYEEHPIDQMIETVTNDTSKED